MAKKTEKAEQPIGVVTIHGLDKMNEAHRMAIAVWLTKTAQFIAQTDGKTFASKYRCRMFRR